MLAGRLNDTLSLIKQSGERVEGIKAMVTGSVIFMTDATLPIEEGDELERMLPSGLAERFTVTERGYYAKTGGIPAHFQTKVRKGAAAQRPDAATTVYNVTGNNARVNVQSTDASTNVVNVAPTELFEQIVSAVRAGVVAEAEREHLIERVRQLERAKDRPSYLAAYQKLISVAADHIAVFGPFLPALAQLAN